MTDLIILRDANQHHFFRQTTGQAKGQAEGYYTKIRSGTLSISKQDKVEIARGGTYAVFPELLDVSLRSDAAIRAYSSRQQELKAAQLAVDKAYKSVEKAKKLVGKAKRLVSASVRESIALDAVKQLEGYTQKEAALAACKATLDRSKKELLQKQVAEREAKEMMQSNPPITVEIFQESLFKRGITDNQFQFKILSLLLQNRVGLAFQFGLMSFNLVANWDMFFKDNQIELVILSPEHVKMIVQSNGVFIDDPERNPQLNIRYEVDITPENTSLNHIRIQKLCPSDKTAKIFRELYKMRVSLWENFVLWFKKHLGIPTPQHNNVIHQTAGASQQPQTTEQTDSDLSTQSSR